MFFFFTQALNDLLIRELRNFWSYHPLFPDLVDNIQGSYGYGARPQRGIVVKISGGDNVRLSPDNFQATRRSFVYKAKEGNKPGVSVEWVVEDAVAIQNNSGVFPTMPGVYTVEIVDSERDSRGIPTGRHLFTIDPQILQQNEGVKMLSPTVGLLKNIPLSGSLKVFELPSNYLLVEDEDYNLDLETGEILLFEPLPSGLSLSADYYVQGEVSGPWPIESNRAHFKALPGVGVAFGRRIVPQDRIPIIITDIREPCDLEYGGRWNFSVDIELWARDKDDQREMADLMLAWIPTILRDHLSVIGVEVETVGYGGEAEEVYDDVGDDYFYTASISMQVQSDWQIHVPISSKIRSLTPVGSFGSNVSFLDIDSASNNRVRFLQNLGLQSFEDPYFINQRRNFQVVR